MSNPKATDQAVQDELNRLRAENELLKAKQAKSSTFRLKVSEKGAVSAYGMTTKFPVTLYKQQWIKLLTDERQAILDFITANDHLLSQSKPAKAVVTPTPAPVVDANALLLAEIAKLRAQAAAK